MSYGASAALQSAVFQHLGADSALAALVGPAIYDALPTGTIPPLYVTLGPEDVRDRSDASSPGAWHKFTVSVISQAAGFSSAKATAAAISDALIDAPLSLSAGRLVALNFDRARARRESGGQLRRIDLTFRARIDGAA